MGYSAPVSEDERHIGESDGDPDAPQQVPATASVTATVPSTSESEGQRAAAPEPIECRLSAAFLPWLKATGGSLALSSDQSRRIILLTQSGRPLIREFDAPMGIAAHGRHLAIAGRRTIVLFSADPRAAAEYHQGQPARFDTLYLPRMTWHVGSVRIHDIAFGEAGLWFVNTRYSCLARLSSDFSFEPDWRPTFITRLTPEDRCHLNGMALVEGRPRFVTALGESDVAQGWRQRRVDGGVLIDVTTDEVLLRGLSMPHSPRWHNQTLYFCESGSGELCRFDASRRERGTVAVLPGYLRGLSFVGPYAVVGLSRIREKSNFGGTPVQARFPQLRCGISIVDLRNGKEVAFAEFTGGMSEIYDVVFLPGVKAPNILNPTRRPEQDAVTTTEFADWIRTNPDSETRGSEATPANGSSRESPLSQNT